MSRIVRDTMLDSQAIIQETKHGLSIGTMNFDTVMVQNQ